MRPTSSLCARLAVIVAACSWLSAAPASAQHHRRDTTGSDTPRQAPSTPAPDAPKAVPRPSDPGPSTGSSGTGSDNQKGGERGRQPSGRSSGSGAPAQGGGNDNAGSRPRNGRPPIGEAVPRTTPPPTTDGGGTVIIPGYGYGGYGGYYGGYYDPYGGYPDPGYGRYPGRYAEGALKLKVKPADAAVYVDGYYTGIVDDYDGFFQRLRMEAGPHRIDIEAPGFEGLTFDVRVDPRRTTTYRGTLKSNP